jgi:hypothetical protein
LVRVATNLGLDVLRRRRRGAYVGAWLPSPIDRAIAARHQVADHTQVRVLVIWRAGTNACAAATK